MEFRFMLAAFASFRIVELFIYDDGPKDILFRLRRRLGVYDLGPDDRPKTTLGRIFQCAYCLGIYIAIALIPLVLIPTALGDLILLTLAIAGTQSVLHKLAGRE